MTKVDGGQAFPSEFFETEHGDQVRPFSGSPGMTLRDYFAAHALAGMTIRSDGTFSKGDHDDHLPEKHARWTASAAYRVADAMLAEREKP